MVVASTMPFHTHIGDSASDKSVDPRERSRDDDVQLVEVCKQEHERDVCMSDHAAVRVMERVIMIQWMEVRGVNLEGETFFICKSIGSASHAPPDPQPVDQCQAGVEALPSIVAISNFGKSTSGGTASGASEKCQISPAGRFKNK